MVPTLLFLTSAGWGDGRLYFERMRVSLIISTYNRPETLRVCLDSVFHQTYKPDEIIIGDDGSTEDTKILIDVFKSHSPIPIIHLWHEDKGFRLAMMRNKCMARAIGEYIIEIDGDVFLHPRFVEDHVSFARKGHYLKGGRVNLGRRLTECICEEGIYRPIKPWTRGIESKPENAIHFLMLSLFLSERYRKRRSPALGCNISFFKEDILRINGYDEFFEGWGGEDEDLGNRLLNSGCKKRYLKFSGIVYHLWHEDKFMYNLERNFTYKDERNRRNAIFCENGIDKYL